MIVAAVPEPLEMHPVRVLQPFLAIKVAIGRERKQKRVAALGTALGKSMAACQHEPNLTDHHKPRDLLPCTVRGLSVVLGGSTGSRLDRGQMRRRFEPSQC